MIGARSRGLAYLCDWLPPEFGAVGQYSLGFARDYAREGRKVVLIGFGRGPRWIEREQHGAGELMIIRLPAPDYDKTRVLSRALWTLRADWVLIREVWRWLPELEEILFTGAPPFLIQFLVPLNLVWRRRLVYRITDFWPECLIAARGRASVGLRLLSWWTNVLRRRVDAFQALGEDQRALLERIGVQPERITIKRDPSPVAFTGREVPLPRPRALDGKVVLLYSGNWGVAHEVDTFVDGYRDHHRRGSGRVGLWLNAVGSGAAEVEARLRQEGLPYARTEPVPLADLARLLVTPDAHLVTLKDAFVGYVLPSKVYGCVASGLPLLFIGSARSDVHRVASRELPAGRYWRVEVGDSVSVARALEAIADLVEAQSRFERRVSARACGSHRAYGG